jgi:transposase
MQHDSTVYVGLDVHKESIMVAYSIDMGEVELLGTIGTTRADIDRMCKRLQSKASSVRLVYEAGPCGYGLYRQLTERLHLHGLFALADSEETGRARQDRPT